VAKVSETLTATSRDPFHPDLNREVRGLREGALRNEMVGRVREDDCPTCLLVDMVRVALRDHCVLSSGMEIAHALLGDIDRGTS